MNLIEIIRERIVDLMYRGSGTICGGG